MRKLLPSLALVLLCAGAQAATPTDESIDALMSAAKSERMLEGVYANMMVGMRRGIEASLQGRKLGPDEQRIVDELPGKFAQIMREEMSWTKLQPVIKQIYRETFTQSEIDGAIAFYRSPAGAAMIEKMPAVQQKSQAAVQPFIPPMVSRIDALMKQTLGQLRPPK